MRTPLIRKLASIALGLIVLGCVWFYLAPAALGGSTTYVVTHGISMEPRFHTGDLALVRSQPSYHVGEIVAYNSKMLHTIVLHRIVGRDGSRYVFKGDNNNFIDPEHPLASQLIGALWVHIPRLGGVLQSIRSPALVGLLIAVGVIMLTGVALTRRRRRRHADRRAEPSAMRPPGQALAVDGPVGGVLALGVLALLPFGVLALLAFTRASTASLPVTSPYTQSGTLTYSAATAPGPVYPSGRAVTGEPLFTRLLSEVEFRYEYRFQAGAAHSLQGKAQLYATVAAANGWQTTLALGSPDHFHGDHTVVAGTLDVTALSEMLRRVETMTKVKSDTYTITIAPHVSAGGRLDGQQLHASFSPASAFSYSEYEIEPPRATGGGVAASSSSGASSAKANPLSSSASATVTGTREQRRLLSLGPLRPSVKAARAIALVGIAIVLCALALAVALVRRRAPRDASATIRARYGHLIVPVERVWPLPGVPVIELGDIDALVRIAEHYERSILHETLERGEAFWVTDESGQFRYAPGSGAYTMATHAPTPDERPLGAAARLADADEDRLAGPSPSSEQQPAAVASAANMATEQQWAPVYYGQPAPDPTAADADDDPHRADASLEASRERARAAFAKSTGLRWSTQR